MPEARGPSFEPADPAIACDHRYIVAPEAGTATLQPVVDVDYNEKGKREQWNGSTYLNWQTSVDAEAPIIDLQTADNQFAALYLGFSSPDLDETQITDYLKRVVQPKLSAVSGVQRADILGRTAAKLFNVQA